MSPRMLPRRVAALAIAALALLAAAPARSDDFADYRIPDHRVLSWTGGFAFQADQQDQSGTPSTAKDGRLSSNALSTFLQRAYHDRSTTGLDLQLVLDGVRAGHQSAARYGGSDPLYYDANRDQTSGRTVGERWSASLWHVRYFESRPLFVRGAVGGVGQLSQGWSKSRTNSAYFFGGTLYSRDEDEDARARETYGSFDASVSAGVGRVRDVTCVYVARVIEERLRQRGTLTRPLSHDARQKLANLVVMAGAFDNVRARPARALWAEIAKVLAEDGALADSGLDAASGWRAGEPLFDAFARSPRVDGLPPASSQRRLGFEAGPYLRGWHYRQSHFEETHSHLVDHIDDVVVQNVDTRLSEAWAGWYDQVMGGVSAEWHRPVGLRWQLDAQGDVAVHLRPDDDGFVEQLTLGATWEIADRWSTNARVTNSRSVLRDHDSRVTKSDNWAFSTSAGLSYALEDHVQLSLSGYANQAKFGFSRSHPFYRRYQLVAGLTYRFAGRFFAPGFPALSQVSRAQPVL